MKTGSPPVRLGDDEVLIMTAAFGRRSGKERSVPYTDIVGVALTETHGFRRGALTLALNGSDKVEVRFSGQHEQTMLSLFAELWRRVQRQRRSPEPAVHPAGTERVEERM